MLKNLCEMQLDDYILICQSKHIPFSHDAFKNYLQASQKIYYAVCLDIDGTLTYKNRDERNKIVEAIKILTKSEVIICFITGRGKDAAHRFISELKDLIRASDIDVNNDHFRRWHCITNNGYMLYSDDFTEENGFLKRSVSLISSDTKSQYNQLRYYFRTEIASFLSTQLDIPYERILKTSDESSNVNTLRFPFPSEYDNKINDDMICEIRKIVGLKTDQSFGVSKGVYYKNEDTVVEISMTTKGQAIEKVAKYLGIPTNRMLRVGDQGNISGNDYEMLDYDCGFSVGKYSSKESTCYPVIADQKIKTGCDAVSYLLKNLKIFPSICLEEPAKEIYVPMLAKSESKNISLNRETNIYYENLLQSIFQTNRLYSSVWDYIDSNTGGFYIHDWEYSLLKATNPEHILFSIYDLRVPAKNSKQPRLGFSVKTDNGLLLRGPMNYYYGLAFRQNEKPEITQGFLTQLNGWRIKFFKICIHSLKNTRLDMGDIIVRRTLLGIMDSARDYLLLCINLHLEKLFSNSDILYFFSEKDSKLFELCSLAKQNLINMYNCLFDSLNGDFINKLLLFLDKLLGVARKNQEFILALNKKYDYNTGCRVWRETDSLYENIIAVDTSIKNTLKERHDIDIDFVLYGIRYGSIELPLISAMLLETKYKQYSLKYRIGVMCLKKAKYDDNHSESFDNSRVLSVRNLQEPQSKNYFHIIMDDNAATGRTLQTAINLLVDKGVYPRKAFLVRYPALNRIEQMFMPYHGAPDTGLFWNFILGLTSPTPYTRLNCPNSYKAKTKKSKNPIYLDELGAFNKTRTFVLTLLFKNGIYGKVSEVAALNPRAIYISDSFPTKSGIKNSKSPKNVPDFNGEG